MTQHNPRLSWKQRLLYTTRSSGDERNRLLTVVNNLVLHLHPSYVPAKALRFSYTWGLGGISITLAALLALTGLLLMFRYDPRVDYAYSSIRSLETEVFLGSLFRAVHHWSANLLVVSVTLHLLRVLFTASFKQGRTMNWLIGLALLILVLASNFTGYLLPWDQLAYWAITVSTTLLTYIPLAGNALAHFLLAGHEVGQGALNNFYALHVVVLPMSLFAIMAYHFWKIRKNGGISQPAPKDGERSERLTTLPHLVSREMAAALAVIAAVLIFSMFVPAPLEQIANPLNSPNPAKAAWYFAGLQELLLHMHPLAAMTLTAIVLLALFLLPRWDRDEADIGVYFRSPVGQRAALLGAFLALDIVPILVVLDEYWLDLPQWLPAWPAWLSNGLLPLLLSLLGLALVYAAGRALVRYQGRKANHSEALLGAFVFIFTALLALTIIGVFFRGPNMALVLPL